MVKWFTPQLLLHVSSSLVPTVSGNEPSWTLGIMAYLRLQSNEDVLQAFVDDL